MQKNIARTDDDINVIIDIMLFIRLPDYSCLSLLGAKDLQSSA